MTTTQPAPSLSDHISARYRTRSCWNPISDHALDEVCKYLQLDSAQTLLDIGCGTGDLTCDWASRFELVALGVDLSSAFVSVARNSANQRGLQSQVQFDALDGNALRDRSRDGHREPTIGSSHSAQQAASAGSPRPSDFLPTSRRPVACSPSATNCHPRSASSSTSTLTASPVSFDPPLLTGTPTTRTNGGPCCRGSRTSPTILKLSID